VKQVLTLVVKLQLSTEQQQLIAATAESFASACNTINRTVNSKLTNRNSIQAVCYHDIKKESGLTANHVVRACARVAANRLTAKQKGKKVNSFKPTSFDCDARTFQLFEKDWSVSISTTGKRVKCPIRASNYHRGKLAGQTPTSAQICQHRDGEWYAHIQIKNEAPSPIKAKNVIGVDFGRREIAKTSTNKGWDGKTINQVRDQYSRTRSSLQRKATQGTRTTRRRCRNILKRLSGRERRFQQWLNHNISKQIVAEAKATQSIIAIEDLTGIRDRSNSKPCANRAPLRYRSKIERRRANSWAFYQLRTFLEYKGIKEGVEVLAIPPAYTSQTCHCCLHIGRRKNKQFKCANKVCGWVGDADLNAAKMIELWGCSVNQPRGSELLSCTIELGLPKAPSVLASL
jgi:IS605 OrfB family transposase